MAMAADSSPSLHSPTAENNLQPFFVLHRALPQRKSAAKARRRIDLSPKTSDTYAEENSDGLRLDTFKILWSNTESIIKDVLKNINANVYGEIEKWVRASFDAIRAHQKLDFTSATCPYPMLNGASVAATGASRQIFTALLFTKNMEFVDDILTFADLGDHLRTHGCHVANLTSLDFSAKNGVGGCLKILLRQFLMADMNAPEMAILASWYTEQESHENPLVVIIDDVERCYGPVLADFIIMLREWVVKIPIILILGVATTVDVLRTILSSHVCSHLSVCEFTLGTPSERMDAVVEAVLLKNCESFSIGKQVSTFLRNYFLRHDGTLTLFIRALKIAMVQHVFAEPSSTALRHFIHGEDTKGSDDENILLGDTVLKQALDLPSVRRCCQPGTNCVDWARCLSELKRLHRLRSSTVMCLHEVGKYHKSTLLDLYCQMLQSEPAKYSDSFRPKTAKENTMLPHDHHLPSSLQSESHVIWAHQIVRDLPATELCKLLSRWENLTSGMKEIHEKITELQLLTTLEENHPKCGPAEASKRPTARNRINQKRDETTANDKVVTFLQRMIRQYIQPIESIPFNEIIFFNDVDRLQAALIGDPRRRIQADLLESNKFLNCSCCKNAGVPIPSMHHTSILYSLGQEHGDLISLHEWFHSFKAILCQSPSEVNRKRSRTSPSPKKRKHQNEPPRRSDASIQAEFCRAVMELQMTGLIRMPSKKRPDYVHRTAFGL